MTKLQNAPLSKSALLERSSDQGKRLLGDDELRPVYNPDMCNTGIGEGKMTVMLTLTAFAAAIGSSFQSGYHTGCVNPIGKEAQRWFNESHYDMFGHNLTTAQNAVAWSSTVGLLNVGGLVGGFFSATMADRLGRKRTLFVNNGFLFLGALFTALATFTDNYLLMPIGRFVIGIDCGIASAIVPMYLTEVAPLSKRGALGAVHQLTFVISMLVSQILGLPSIIGNADHWYWIFFVALLPAVLQLFLLPLCPESPKFSLIVNKNTERAIRDLRRLRGRGSVSEEVAAIQAEFERNQHHRKVSIVELVTNPLYQRRTFIAVMLMLALQFSGVSAVFFYSRTVFEQAGLTGSEPFYATIAVGFLNVVMTVVSARLLDHPRFGRRSLHLIGLCGMFIATLLLVASMSMTSIATAPFLKHVGSIGAVLSMFMFIVFFAAGPGPIPWFFVSEIFPSHAKASASSLAVMSCWLSGSIVGIGFLPINNILGHYSFLIFSVLLFLFILFSYNFVPETKGKTVAEVERDLGLDSCDK